jgi:hypothetical protein
MSMSRHGRDGRHGRHGRRHGRHVEGGGLGFGLAPYKLVPDPEAQRNREQLARNIREGAAAAAYGTAAGVGAVGAGLGYGAYHGAKGLYTGAKYVGEATRSGAAAAYKYGQKIGSSFSDINTKNGVNAYRNEVCENSLINAKKKMGGFSGYLTDNQKRIFAKLEAETALLKPCRMRPEKLYQDLESDAVNAEAYNEPSAFSGVNPMMERRRQLELARYKSPSAARASAAAAAAEDSESDEDMASAAGTGLGPAAAARRTSPTAYGLSQRALRQQALNDSLRSQDE